METQYKVNNKLIELVQGSITRYSADALVCPANADLEMVAFPGGVQFAFLREGGEQIFRESSKLRKKYGGAVEETSAHLTNAGNLPAKYVIHSVAVGYKEGKGLYVDTEIIRKSTKNALDLANEKKLKSIGFPAFGTGLYNAPLDDVVNDMGEEFISHLKNQTSLERIGLVLYSSDQYILGKKELDGKFNSK